jgi:CDGSH-type Zn-finger protein
MISKADFSRIEATILAHTGYCLCGHSESCSVCDGTARREREAIVEALEKEFLDEIEK